MPNRQEGSFVGYFQTSHWGSCGAIDMKMKYQVSAAVAVLVLGMASVASATPLVLTGNYIKVGISDRGTLGSNGATSPGLLHDPTGTGTFGINDYITPGTPHEGFSVHSTELGFRQNDNKGISTFGFTSPTLLTGAAKMGFANAATWSGSTGGLNITNSYFFNAGDQRINVITTLTAVTDQTSLAFARSVDPDPDVATFGSFSTNNQRGNFFFGASDFIGAAGPKTGLTLALLNLNGAALTHDTQINGACCNNIDPYTVLTGGVFTSVGDHGLNMAWMVGNLAAGKSTTIKYAYLVGDKIETIGHGVPEPATWAMLVLGFGGVGGLIRNRRRVAVAA